MAMVSKMVATDNQTESLPSSPAPAEGSCRSHEVSQDHEIQDFLQNLPSKVDLANMFGKLETAFQSKMDAMGADVQQVSLRVTDLEEEKDV
ncbi:Hypothetical predicted protein, partial [Pelobates cultripes]